VLHLLPVILWRNVYKRRAVILAIPMNTDSKILSELEKSKFGLSTLGLSKKCKINRLTAIRHLKKLVESGDIVQHTIHQKLLLFLPAKKSHRRD